MDFVNGLVEEGTFIRIDTKLTLEEEQKWVSDHIRAVTEDRMVHVIVEKDGQVVANSEISKIGGHQAHIGILAIGVKKGFRGIGIGKKMIEILLARAPAIGIEIVSLQAVADNAPAIALYTSLGFEPLVTVSKDFKFDHQYHNSILMRKDLAKNRENPVS